MRENTQLHWIAEAEARSLQESAFSQCTQLDPPIGIVWAEPSPLWREWMLKTLSRLTPTRSCRVAWRSDRRPRG
jgi:hypothetical protein